MARTVTSVWGADAANELAAIAIDLLAAPPLKHSATRTSYAQISWKEIERGREIMDRYDIRWRGLRNRA